MAAVPPDVEERYKQVMLTNAQLDNDKQKLMYEVDALKDQLADSQELTMQLQLDLSHTSRVRHHVICHYIMLYIILLLDNDKQKLMYEVDALKDQLSDSQELTTQLQLDLSHTSRVRHFTCHCISSVLCVTCHIGSHSVT